ncbi:hypothetical protein AAE478_008546 [Parahypoxylon ruwenzoriense]
MPPDDLLTDDYVAELLAKEASDCSLKYSAVGLDAFKSNKRPANQPKPNTRFLNNIIRDTNSHNRALLAKENAESQAKLRDLEDAEKKKRKEEERRLRRSKPGPGDTRKRMLGDIAAILGGPSKRRRTEKMDKPTSNVLDSADHGFEGSPHRRRKAPLGDDNENMKRRNSRKGRSSETDGTRQHSYHRERVCEEAMSSSNHRDRKSRERSPRRKSDLFDNQRPSNTAKRLERESSASQETSDSDPLEEIIGPVPAAKSAINRRGRGANSATSGIDSRFAPDYDPRKDITPDPEDADDWDDAVEAFRDHQKWKRRGADRLLSAGFTEEQIKKWEKGDQKDEADVQWNKPGGLREWDRGKVVNKDGTVSVEPKWN